MMSMVVNMVNKIDLHLTVNKSTSDELCDEFLHHSMLMHMHNRPSQICISVDNT